MNYRSHVFFGGLLCLAFMYGAHSVLGWYSFPSWDNALMVLIIVLGTLIPDGDHENSMIQQFFVGSGLVIAAGGLALLFLEFEWAVWILAAGVLLAGFSFLMAQVAKHRGFMHSIPFCIIFALFIFIVTGFSYELGVLGFVACWSHLLLDGLPFKTK